jgi:hypothetical protein
MDLVFKGLLLTGRSFGRLSVLRFLGKRGRKPIWECMCLCGKVVPVFGENLKSGHTQSCGCLKIDKQGAQSVKHGLYRHPEYEHFRLAKRRCIDPTTPAFKNYGAKGVKFKFHSFEQFLKVIGGKPSRKHSIERIDCDGDYEPGNVRWANNREQANNKTNSLEIVIEGKRKTVAEWCGGGRTKHARLTYRRIRNGWCKVCAFQTPAESSKPLCPHN